MRAFGALSAGRVGAVRLRYPLILPDTTNADVGGLRKRTALNFDVAKIEVLFHITKHFGEKVIFRGTILIEYLEFGTTLGANIGLILWWIW